MLFSIIVPVYNAMPYLDDCIRSLLAQTERDFELILVDDGSQDSSGRVCDSYAQNEKRVRVIHQKNGGQTRAREAGLKLAEGSYIIFVDADDWIEKDMLKRAALIIRQMQAELISFAQCHEYREGGRVRKAEPVPEGIYRREEIKKDIYPRILMDDSLHNMAYNMGKVVERKLLLTCMEMMDHSLRQGEDAALSVLLYTHASCIYVSAETMYHYRVTSQSASNRFRTELYEQVGQTVRYFEKLSVPEVPDWEPQVHRYAVMTLFSIMLMAVEVKADPKMLLPYMKTAYFRKHIQNAKFRKITPKTRITFWMYRRGLYAEAYKWLAFCRKLKKGA